MDASSVKTSSSRTGPRILLISAHHHLMGELLSACRELGIEHAHLFVGHISSGAELEAGLSDAVEKLRPDFFLTINHSGLDREGLVSELCRTWQRPCLSWFVDRPDLFLPYYRNLDNPWLAYAVWDLDARPSLEEQAAGRVFHLPLGADLARIKFAPGSSWQRRVGFVGNSMQKAVDKSWQGFRQACGQALSMQDFWSKVAQGFATSTVREIGAYLQQEHPLAWEQRCSLDAQKVAALDAFLYWRSTQEYRIRCVRELLPFTPVIAGDDKWSQPLGEEAWKYAGALNYYTELPLFYAQTMINFNTTSMQMKGAFNQRVFDVPASGGFLLTDYREQLEEAFVIGQEVVCYAHVEEIKDLIRYFLRHPKARAKITSQARQRLEKEHGYTHRLRTICQQMHQIFGTPACV